MKTLQLLLQLIIASIHNYIDFKNIYVFYEISKNFNISNYSTQENCLFGAVSSTKMLILISINILDIELDLIDMIFFSHPIGVTGRNIIIFGVDMS